MSLYNIVNPSLLVAGQPEDISQVLANFQAIQNVLNGNIEDVNIKALGVSNPSLAAGILASKIAGYPADATKVLAGDGSWPSKGGITYRKVTPKAVNTTVAATDLLNGEITVAANALSATGFMRFSAMGDWLQHSGAVSHVPRFQFKLGATTLFDTGVGDTGAGVNDSATRGGWWARMTLSADNATNAQSAFFEYWVGMNTSWAGTLQGFDVVFTTGVGGNFGMSQNLANGMVFGAAYSTSTEDMTLAKLLAFNTINGSNSALYETKLISALVEIV